MEALGIIGNYLVERELGRGGMGVVYAAKHRVLGRPAAIKVLLANTIEHRDRVERFFNEARAAMAVKHRGVVEVYDVGIAADERAYIAMELLEGGSLANLLARGPLPLRQALDYAKQIADALGAAHDAGVIHRDLKPENIIVARDRLVIVDFGIAKLAGPATVRTVTGAVMGTPLYMSPEQCEGEREIDARSDLYSLGCVLFAMLTGRPPFQGGATGALIGQHLHVAPPPLRSRCPQASEALERLVAVLLAKSRDDRFRTARAVSAALAAPEVAQLAGPPGVAATADFAPAVTPPAYSAEPPPQTRSAPPPFATPHPHPVPAHSPPLATPHAPLPARGRGTAIAIVAGSCAITALVVLLATRSCTGTSEPVVAKLPADAAPVEQPADAAIATKQAPPDANDLTAEELRAVIATKRGDKKHPRPNTGSGSAKPPDVVATTRTPVDAGVPERTPEPVREEPPPRPPPVAIRESVRFSDDGFSSSAVPESLVARISAAIKADPGRKVFVVGRAEQSESRQPGNLAVARANAVVMRLTSGMDRIPRGSISATSEVVTTSDGSGRRADIELRP